MLRVLSGFEITPVALSSRLKAGAGDRLRKTLQGRAGAGLVRAMRYPPRGARSAGTGRIAVLGADYRSTADDQILVIPQIEDMEGIDNAEAIMAVEGVDVGFLGPNDLALSMGVEPGHPDHEAAIQKHLSACKKVGKPAGIPIRTVEGIKQRMAEGFQLIDIASDLRLLEVAARDVLAAVKG